MDNGSNSNIKQFLSIILGFISMYLVTTNNKMLMLLSMGLIVSLICSWYSSLKIWIHKVELLYKEIRARKYFFVTDNGYRTDLKKRRELGEYIYKITNFGFFFIVFMLIIFSTFFGKIVSVPIYMLVIIFLCIAMIGIILQARNYLTSLYYYLIPILPLLFYIDLLGSSEIIALILFFLLIAVIYLIFVLIIPIHFLRKINNTTLIFGVLLSIVIPILFDVINGYFSENFLSRIDSLVYSEFINSIENQQVLNFIIDNPDLNNFLKVIFHTMGRVSLIEQKEFLSQISFLWLSSYAIGSLIINTKLKVASLVAEDLYSKIQDIRNRENIEYEVVRDCIYFGGERFQELIFYDKSLKWKIREKEKELQFYQETNKAIRFAQWMRTKIIKLLKRLIYKEIH
ncbi:hypothetical protein [Streptococcus ovuberis]|uniref:Uncharacterized protein n=2 Tax=Streptococcus TaxID=1301 RepID=A0A7X6S0T9_9STRE|nr:hypothetical protein [Streptococcus ovuberis]NKZ19486.1 hypothetical protein [Streptococcus ovuberis]